MKLTTTGINIYPKQKKAKRRKNKFMIIVNDDTSLEAVDQPKAICFSNSSVTLRILSLSPLYSYSRIIRHSCIFFSLHFIIFMFHSQVTRFG